MAFPRGNGSHRGGRGSRGRGGFGGMHIPAQGGRGRGRGGHGGGVFANAVVLRNDNGGPLPPITIPPSRAPQGGVSGVAGTNAPGGRVGGSASPVPPLTMATSAGSPELPSPNTGGGFTHGVDVVSGGGGYMDPHEGGSSGGGGTTTLVPTIIQRSRPYFTQAQIDMIKPVEDQAWASRDTTMRLNACTWILQVGGVLQFPIRTMGTAMQLFNRFKLFYPKWEHSFVDCAAAALFVASKIEDTLKKSREILAVGHSIKHGTGSAEAINPDSPLLDEACRRCLSLERLILESISFDFRIRHPQPFIIKFCRYFNIPRPITQQAWEIQIDTYRTLSPLKATPHTQAYAAIELACKLEGYGVENVVPYEKWYMDRIEVLDVMKDLLDLWTHYRVATMVGERFSGDRYIALRIQVNKESEALVGKMKGVNGLMNGGGRKEKDGAVAVQMLAPGINELSEKDKLAIGESVRFMLDGERERRERGSAWAGSAGMGMAT